MKVNKMSLDYNLTKIKNLNKNEYNPIPMFSTLHLLIFGSMAIGIDEITNKNCKEIFNRYKYCHKMNYFFYNNKPLELKLKDIKRYIGLSTNADNLNVNEFIFKIALSKYKEIDNSLMGMRLKTIETYNPYK